MTKLMNAATMEEEVEEESVATETPKPGGSSLGVVPSLTAQCCAFLRMKSFEELGRELGKEKLLMATEAAGTEASSAGKIRRRSGGGRQKSWVDVIAGRDYLDSKKLRKAASDGSYDDLLQEIRRGADVTKPDSKGRTALHFAATRGDTNMVKVLVSYGASVNQRDCNGNTPLHLACCTHHVGVVTALLKSGTDVNAADSRGVTPLHLALSRLRMLGGKGERGGGSKGTDKVVESEGEGGNGTPTFRKKEIIHIVEMLKEYLHVSKSSETETMELEKLAGQLSISETPQQVDEVQDLLESFTSLSLQKRQEAAS